jgi:3-hydroxyacyl-[acyl-carrier-protein] dehydratase
MRWFWIDRIIEFESGRRAVAIKNVSLSEDHLHDSKLVPPLMPAPLMIEGVAQTGGLLVGEHLGFRARVILAKVGKVEFFGEAQPGDTLTYTVELIGIRSTGAIITGQVHLGEQRLASLEIVFALLDERFADIELFDAGQLLSTLRCCRMYEVGRQADGSPLQLPPFLAEAEQALLQADQPSFASNF